MTDDEPGRVFNFKLSQESEVLLDGFARLGHCSRAQVVRDALISFAEIYAAGLVAEQEAWRALIDEVGEDASIVIFCEADENDEPVVHVTTSWEAIPASGPSEDTSRFTATGVVAGDRVHVYVDFSGVAKRTAVARVGDETVRVSNASLRIGPTLSWPPKEHEAIRLRLSALVQHGFDPEHGAEVGRRYLDIVRAFRSPDAAQADQVEA